MSFRTVVINKHCKLDFRMNYMEIRQPEGKKRIYLDEIEVLIVENPAISLTGCLLSELMKRKVKVIFCDGKHNPQGEVVSYYGGYDSARKLRRQLSWSDETKGEVWTAIVTEKIRQQAQFLHELEHEREAGLLDGYVAEMAYMDKHNREGLAHTAILTKPYYLGVFELTQEQMFLMTGSYGMSGGIFTGGQRQLRPTATSYANLRGAGHNGTINWPITGSEVASSSIIKGFRDKTGSDGFDIPTECEWEYANRCGGMASGFFNDGSDAGIPTSTKFTTVENGNSALERLGRYQHNGGMTKTDNGDGTYTYTAAAMSSDESVGTAIVGSYEPNAWGFYDMHGNVSEWCNGVWPGTWATWLNSEGYYCYGKYPLTDDVGPSSATWGQYSYRIARGGRWSSPAWYCLIPRRGTVGECLYTEGQAAGIRLCWRFPTPAQTQE